MLERLVNKEWERIRVEIKVAQLYGSVLVFAWNG